MLAAMNRPDSPTQTPGAATVLMTDGTVHDVPTADLPDGLPELGALLEQSIATKDARTMTTKPTPPAAAPAVTPLDLNDDPASRAVPFMPHAGVGVTIYGNLPRDIRRDVVEAADFVSLHTLADATDVTSAGKVRSMGCDRVWLCLPANYFVRLAASKGVAAAVAEAQRCAKVAVDMEAEVLEFNGEGDSTGKVPGDWIPADPQEASRLVDLAGAILDAARDVLHPAGVAVAWTSHDMPSFALPWAAILSRVDLHSPQHYPAEKGRTVKQPELTSRIARCAGRWESLVERGAVPADMIPGGNRWVPYLQGWGHTLGASVWGLCEAPVTRLWAFPGSWDDVGLKALHAARALRGAAGFGPDAVERFQEMRGLDRDGVVGKQTLTALRSLTPIAL